MPDPDHIQRQTTQNPVPPEKLSIPTEKTRNSMTKLDLKYISINPCLQKILK